MASARDWTDKDTGDQIVLYSFQLEGDKRYYRTGTTDTGVQEGDTVRFVCDGRGTVDTDTVEIGVSVRPQRREAPARKPARAASGGQRTRTSAPAGGNSRDQYWADKEKRDLEKDERYQTVEVPRIVLMAAQDRAVRLVSAALDNDALTFGTVAKGKKLDMLLSYVDQVTDKFMLDAFHAAERLETLQSGGSWNFGEELQQEQEEDLGDDDE